MFAKIKKSQSRNNFTLETESLNSVKDYEKTVVTLGIATIIRNKEFVKSVTDNLHSPKCLKDLKKAKKLARIYEYTEYVDNGISYAYMAEKFGCSIKTMVEIVKFAVKNEFLVLKNNVEKLFSKNVNHFLNKYNSIFTFSTKDYIYKVYANSYTCGRGISWYI